MSSGVTVLDVLLYGEPVGTLTRVGGDRVVFAFTDEYIESKSRPTLSLSYKDSYGELITNFKPTQTKLSPFFSNLLPEGSMRDYLADRAKVHRQREFFLLWVLGRDLPGAITVQPADGEDWPADAHDGKDDQREEARENALRFSLAGVQLKFSALHEARGGLTIPASGVGGSWIVKLPSREFDGVPENEFSMMQLASKVGIEVPEHTLIDVDAISNLPTGIGSLQGQAFAIKRFDRTEAGEAVHMEDFAQVFGVYAADKYKKASYRNIATVLGVETDDADIAEFIRRLTFNTLIGNADMHLKNWSLLYPDKRNASLAPAYDFVSTIAYIEDSDAALKFSRTKRFDGFTLDELSHMAAKARLPEKLVLDSARETVERFMQEWASEKPHLPIYSNARDTIDEHLAGLPLVTDE